MSCHWVAKTWSKFCPNLAPMDALPSSCNYILANDKGGHYVEFSHGFMFVVVLPLHPRGKRWLVVDPRTLLPLFLVPVAAVTAEE